MLKHLDILRSQISLLLREKSQALEHLNKYGDHIHDCATYYSSEEACTCGFNAMRDDIIGEVIVW